MGHAFLKPSSREVRKPKQAQVERTHIGALANSTTQVLANSQHQPPHMQVKMLPDDSSPQPSSHPRLQVFPGEAPDTVEERQAIPTFPAWIPDPQNPGALK